MFDVKKREREGEWLSDSISILGSVIPRRNYHDFYYTNSPVRVIAIDFFHSNMRC